MLYEYPLERRMEMSAIDYIEKAFEEKEQNHREDAIFYFKMSLGLYEHFDNKPMVRLIDETLKDMGLDKVSLNMLHRESSKIPGLFEFLVQAVEMAKSNIN